MIKGRNCGPITCNGRAGWPPKASPDVICRDGAEPGCREKSGTDNGPLRGKGRKLPAISNFSDPENLAFITRQSAVMHGFADRSLELITDDPTFPFTPTVLEAFDAVDANAARVSAKEKPQRDLSGPAESLRSRPDIGGRPVASFSNRKIAAS